MHDIMTAIDEYKEQQDKLHPDRHKFIHKTCCNECPTNRGVMNGTIDQESAEIRETFSKELIATEFLFVCYKRPNKICCGIAKFMDIDQKFLDDLNGR